ncbi:MAG TPA: cytochrome c biogenesis protein ResB [Streptosporangiaceae bacterium]
MAEPGIPRIGVAGWARWGWRQLTSMRTALVLLFLIAVGAVPGSMLPQRGQAPERVADYLQRHRTLGPLFDRLSLFDVFAAPWFAAIYILLFVSLAGCVIPRAWRHFAMIRARPPAAPRQLSRLPLAASYETAAPPAEVLATAAGRLRGRRFRLETAGDGATGGAWVAAEKGYLRETGNLVFHLALLALLFAVGAGAMYGYKGNVLLTEGKGFSNTLAYYDAFRPGREFSPGSLPPFSVRLDDFTAKYVVTGERRGQPTEFRARLRVTDRPGARERPYELRVNHPLEIGGAKVYLLGHGYAPTFTVRDGRGQVAFQGPVPFLPDDGRTFTSEGVIKVPDAAPTQLGFIGLFWPTAAPDASGRTTVSAFPAPINPMVALFPFKGDLGLDSGVPQSVYKLDAARMQRINVTPRPLRIGETVTLPDGAGSVTYTGYREWVSLSVNHDPGRGPALVAAIIAIAGIVTSFLVRRRRVWVRAARVAEGRTVVEIGGLALGGTHPEFDDVVADLRATALPVMNADTADLAGKE